MGAERLGWDDFGVVGVDFVERVVERFDDHGGKRGGVRGAREETRELVARKRGV